MSAEHILDMAREVEAGVKARAAARVSQGELRVRERALTAACLAYMNAACEEEDITAHYLIKEALALPGGEK